MTPFRLGLLVALPLLVLDQVTKYWVLDFLDWGLAGRVTVTPFFDLVLVWNYGISYGLFQQDGVWGPRVLVAIAAAATAGFGYWLLKTPSKFVAAALGLLISGAVGNGIDRAIYGAVIDFVSLHAYGFYWYVFNVADAAIVAGVALLVYDMITERRNVDENAD